MAKLKLTKEIIKTASNYRALGTPIKTICDAIDIDESTWFDWYNKGEKLKDDRTLYTQFSKSVKKAKADMIARNLQKIDKASDDGIWQAAAWKLERLDPENFGKKDRRDANDNEAVRDLADAIRGIK